MNKLIEILSSIDYVKIEKIKYTDTKQIIGCRNGDLEIFKIYIRGDIYTDYDEVWKPLGIDGVEILEHIRKVMEIYNFGKYNPV